MMFFILILIMIYYSNFMKILLISEIFLSLIFINLIFLNNENSSIFMIFISMMIIESCLGIFLMFEFMNLNKMFYLNISIMN